MKAILIILVVALGGLTYKFQLDAKSAKAKMIAAEDATHEAETAAKDAKSALDDATKKIARLEKDVAAQLAEIDTLKRAAIAGVAASKSQPAPATTDPAPTAAAVVATMEARLDEIEKIYNQNLAQITDQRARLEANHTRVSGEIDVLQNNPPTFSEQTSRTSSVTGLRVNSGVRTSAADREEAIEKHKTALANLNAQIAAIQEEQVKLNAKELALNKAYYAARSKIIEE